MIYSISGHVFGQVLLDHVGQKTIDLRYVPEDERAKEKAVPALFGFGRRKVA